MNSEIGFCRKVLTRNLSVEERYERSKDTFKGTLEEYKKQKVLDLDEDGIILSEKELVGDLETEWGISSFAKKLYEKPLFFDLRGLQALLSERMEELDIRKKIAEAVKSAGFLTPFLHQVQFLSLPPRLYWQVMAILSWSQPWQRARRHWQSRLPTTLRTSIPLSPPRASLRAIRASMIEPISDFRLKNKTRTN